MKGKAKGPSTKQKQKLFYLQDRQGNVATLQGCEEPTRDPQPDNMSKADVKEMTATTANLSVGEASKEGKQVRWQAAMTKTND